LIKIPWRLKSTDEREQKEMDRELPGNQITTAVWQEITPSEKASKICCVCAQPK
jgi:hypothetical protein